MPLKTWYESFPAFARRTNVLYFAAIMLFLCLGYMHQYSGSTVLPQRRRLPKKADSGPQWGKDLASDFISKYPNNPDRNYTIIKRSQGKFIKIPLVGMTEMQKKKWDRRFLQIHEIKGVIIIAYYERTGGRLGPGGKSRVGAHHYERKNYFKASAIKRVDTGTKYENMRDKSITLSTEAYEQEDKTMKEARDWHFAFFDPLPKFINDLAIKKYLVPLLSQDLKTKWKVSR